MTHGKEKINKELELEALFQKLDDTGKDGAVLFLNALGFAQFALDRVEWRGRRGEAPRLSE